MSNPKADVNKLADDIITLVWHSLPFAADSWKVNRERATGLVVNCLTAALTEQQAEAAAQAYRRCADWAYSNHTTPSMDSATYRKWADESVKEAGR